MSTVEQSTPRANKKPGKKAAFIGITFVLVITVLLLANRYLVEHVQTAAGATASNAVADATYAADQWNYASDSKTISIKEVTSGNGQNKVTYYVADVTVDDASILQSAFAKNEYGTNIIETNQKRPNIQGLTGQERFEDLPRRQYGDLRRDHYKRPGTLE